MNCKVAGEQDDEVTILLWNWSGAGGQDGIGEDF